MNERQRLMSRISALDFAVIELHIFLDTHPNDTEAAKKLDEYLQKAQILREEYEKNFGPIQAGTEGANRWAWIANPWPWDTKGDEK